VIRRQLPAYSPLALPEIARAAGAAIAAPARERERLRDYLAGRFDAGRVLLTASGTQALEVALRVAPSGGSAQRLVALPAYSCYDLVTAAVGAQVRVLFYDVDPTSLTPDADDLSRVLRRGATAVVAANLFGFPIDWPAVRAQCAEAGAVLIEDAAQALGSSWGGVEGGAFGDLTVLSFGRGKGWTGGGGGALLSREEAGPLRSRLEAEVTRASGLAESSKAGALTFAQWLLGRPAVYGLLSSLPGTGLGETRYKEPSAVRDVPAFCAATVLRHARLALDALELRRRSARVWDDVIGSGGRWPPVRGCEPLAHGGCGFLRYPVLAGEPDQASRLAEAARAAGAERGYPIALPDLGSAGPVLVASEGSFPGARDLAGSLVTLPTHPLVRESDHERVRRAL